MYFQEYARSIFEIEVNKIEKEGEKDAEKEGEKGEKGGKGEKENEYQQILEGTSSDEKSVSLSMEPDLNSRNKSDDKGTINIPNENKSIISIKCDEGKDCRECEDHMKGKGICEDEKDEKDGTDEIYEKDGKECEEKREQQKGGQDKDKHDGNIVEHSQEVITPHQWQHFEPFFKWLDNPDKLPEVRWENRVD